MRKYVSKFMLSAILVSLAATSGLAAEQSLEEQVRALSRQNEAQSERLRELEAKVVGRQDRQEADAGDNGLLAAINDHVDLSALVEVEANSNRAFDKSKSSDISLATVEIGLEGRVSPWSAAHILLKYEEGEEDDHVFIDEGTISLGNMEKFPLMLQAGKMYVPFGAYNSAMISDPLTLEIGETNDTAIQLVTEVAAFQAGAFVFNGNTDETGAHDRIKTFGAHVGYTLSSETFNLETGLDWLSNIADSNGLADHISTTSGTVADTVSGLAAHATMEIAGFTVTGEYVAALDGFAVGEVYFRGKGAKPKAYNLEAAYTMEIIGKATTLALGYQTTDEALDLGLPESRITAAANMEILPYTSLALEFCHNEDYAISDGGSGEDGQTITMQLALAF